MGPIFQKMTSFLFKTNMPLLEFTATLPQKGPSVVTASFLTPQESTTTAKTPRANKLKGTQSHLLRKKAYLGQNIRIWCLEFKGPIDRK